MSAYVIDTNVPIVANGRSDSVAVACVVKCVRKLVDVRAEATVVLDDGMRILSEYLRHLNPKGQPGAGDLFMKWVWDNRGVTAQCERVSITPLPDDPEDFVEFPRDSRLASFHRKDRKFVAVACASKNNPEVLNATDSDWWIHRQALGDHGVRVVFLCPERFEN
jgi:hypothetical protein